MLYGFVHVLFFTGLCSSVDVTIKDLKITTLVTPTTSTGSVSGSEIPQQITTTEVTEPSKCNNTKLVEKTLQTILTIMNRNVERQVQTSYLMNLLLKILEKNVDSFSSKETELMNNILKNLEAGDAIQGPVVSNSLRSSRLKHANRNSFCALALLKILKLTKSFLGLFNRGVPGELYDDSENYMEESSDEYPSLYQRPYQKHFLSLMVPSSNGKNEIDQVIPAVDKTIDNVLTVKPINLPGLETQNVHPFYTEDESPESIEQHNISKQVAVLSGNLPNDDQSNIDILYDDPHKDIDLQNSFFSTNYLIQKEKLNKIKAPMFNKITVSELNSSSNNYYPVVPEHDSRESINLPPNYDSPEEYNTLPPLDYLQSPTVEFTTKNNLLGEHFVQFDHKLITNPTEIISEEENKPVMFTVSKKDLEVENVTPEIQLVSNYSSSKNDNINVDYIETTTKKTGNIDDDNNDDYSTYSERYPVYDLNYNYIDKGLTSENPIHKTDNVIYSFVPKETNYNSNGLLQIHTSTTKSPLPYHNDDPMPKYYDKNIDWDDNDQDQSNIKTTMINDFENRDAEYDPWMSTNYPWNVKHYSYNDNTYIKPQVHTNLVYDSQDPIENNYKTLDSWHEKPSKYDVEENVGSMDSRNVVLNSDSDWYDQHSLEVEFTTKYPVSTDEVKNQNHYSNWEHTFQNDFGDIEFTTKTTPITIDGKYSYPIYNVLPDSYQETFDIMPIPILNQVTEDTIHLNKLKMPDNPNLIDTDYLNIPNNDDVIENVIPSNYAEGFENPTKLIHIINKNHLVYQFPPTHSVNKGTDVFKETKNIVNKVTPPYAYYWNDNNPWNQVVEVAKDTIPINKYTNSNYYSQWYNNIYSPRPQNQANKNETSNFFDYSPPNEFFINEKMPSKMENYLIGSLGTHNIYENADQSYGNSWNSYPSNQNAYTNEYSSNIHYLPSVYDFNTQKDVIEITTHSPNVFWKKETVQKPYNSEILFQSLVNYEPTTQIPKYDSLEYIDKNTEKYFYPLPSNDEHPWQLDIEVTTKYSIILHDAPDYDFLGKGDSDPWDLDQHSKRDGDFLDSSVPSNENRDGKPKNELETFNSSISTENNNQSINNNPFESNYSIVATDRINRIPKDVNEDKESTQTLENNSLNVNENQDLYYINSEDNPTEHNQTIVNNIENDDLELEPEVIKLIEETLENMKKNVDTNTDPKVLESIEQLKRMIKEPNLSINSYIQILRTFHVITEQFKLFTDVGNIMSVPYLYRLINKNNTENNGHNVVEITYLIKSPKPIVIYPYYYVKYHVPITEIDQLLSQNSNMTENDEEFHLMLLRLSKIADLSPALKKVSKEDVDKLTIRNGSLIKSNLINSEGTILHSLEIQKYKIKSNATEVTRSHAINGNEKNIKEVRIKVNNKPYHTITTIGDFRGTPIIEENSPRIDNLNDLSNPFRKIFPTYKLQQATALASEQRKHDQLSLIPPYRREEIHTAKKYTFTREFDRNHQNIKQTTRDGQALPYKNMIDDRNEFIDNTRGEIVPQLNRFNSEPNIKMYRTDDNQLYIPSNRRLDNQNEFLEHY